MTDRTAPEPRRTPSARGLILTVVIAAMLFSSVYPLGRYVAVRNDIEALEAEDDALAERFAELTEEAESLEDPDVIEQIAREELGFVRPGEVPFVLLPPADGRSGPSAAVPVPRAPEPQRERRGLLARWWDAMRAAATAIT